MEERIKKVYSKVKGKKNVIGHSNQIIQYFDKQLGKKMDTVIVYVKKKEKEEFLSKQDLIPRYVKGMRVKVIEIGKVEALNIDRTQKVRPVLLGLSVGHHDITAGSLGMMFIADEVVVGSNAHVISPNAGMNPDDVKEKRIYQPGPYHQGTPEENICGEYIWHKQIKPATTPSPCKISKGIVACLNFIWSLFGRHTRFQAFQENVNHIDFGIYRPSVEHLCKLPDDQDFPGSFIGLLFAGSDKVGVICKVKYIIDEGFTPRVSPTEVKQMDVVWGSSFWGDYQTTVQDESATIQVSYGDFTAIFEDVILVHNEDVIRGGWSGSSFYKVG